MSEQLKILEKRKLIILQQKKRDRYDRYDRYRSELASKRNKKRNLYDVVQNKKLHRKSAQVKPVQAKPVQAKPVQAKPAQISTVACIEGCKLNIPENITILGAWYGVPGLRGGTLRNLKIINNGMIVTNETMGGDPYPDRRKILIISYQLDQSVGRHDISKLPKNFGNVTVACVEGYKLTIPENINILRAWWGVPGERGGTLRDYKNIKNGMIVTNKTVGGDTYHGRIKTLVIIYNHSLPVLKGFEKIVIVTTPILKLGVANNIKKHIKQIIKTVDVEIITEFPILNNYNHLYIFLYFYNIFDISKYPRHYIVWQIEQLTSKDQKAWQITQDKIEVFNNAINIFEISMKNYNYDSISREKVLYNPLPFYNENNSILCDEKNIDCVFFGTPNIRRQNINKYLKRELYKHGITFKILYSIFDKELTDILEKTKYVINLHYYDKPCLEGARINIAIENNCVTISEDVFDDENTRNLYKDYTIYNPCIKEDLSNIDIFVKSIIHNLKPEIYKKNISNFNKDLLSVKFENMLEKNLSTCMKIPSPLIQNTNISIKNKKKIDEHSVKTGVVITTHGYNGVFARQCLNSYIRELPKNYFIVLFINESSDNITLNLKKTNNINIVYIENQTESGGLTGTWNKGIDMCLENNCDVIILSNDDILFDSCINNIIWSCYNEKNEMKYFGPISNNPGPKNCIINKCQYGEHPEIRENKKALYKNEICNLNGFFMVFSKKVLLKNKFDDKYYFDPNKPFGGNETEWFIRFKEKGGIPIIVPQTFIYHYKLACWRDNKKENNICIFTANTGSYEGDNIHLKKSNIDTLYFTDNFNTIYKCIKLGLLPFYVDTKGKETKLIQRTIKTNPCNFLPYNYETSVYVDGNIQIINYNLLNNYIQKLDYDVICFKHPNRTMVIYEGDEVIKLKLETKENVGRICNEFKKNNFKDDIGLTETNVLIRNHKNIHEFNEDWCRCINICRRDQISFDFMLFKHNVKYLKKSYKDKLSLISRYKHINTKNRCVDS
jgi:hypothetical protein